MATTEATLDRLLTKEAKNSNQNNNTKKAKRDDVKRETAHLIEGEMRKNKIKITSTCHVINELLFLILVELFQLTKFLRLETERRIAIEVKSSSPLHFQRLHYQNAVPRVSLFFAKPNGNRDTFSLVYLSYSLAYNGSICSTLEE